MALVIRPFATWQVGTWLWLAVGTLLGIIVGLFILARRFLVRKRSGPKPDRIPTPPLVVPDRAPVFDADRRRFLIQGARGTAWAGAFLVGGWGLARASDPPRVVRLNLSLPELPREAHGLTIAHLSDLHVGGWTTEDEIAQTMDLTRSLKPDLVVITGDLIDRNPAFGQALVKYLPLLGQVPLGVLAVIGNHDVYTGAASVTAVLDGHGLAMLRNRHHSLKAEGLSLAIIGVDDNGRQWTGSGGEINLRQAMKGLSPDLFPILLAHRPTSFDEARAAGVPLTLCGHTHGGQFGLPGGFNLADLAYVHSHGLYREQGSLLYVSAGLGSVGLPFRIGMPPEIGLLRLVRA